MLPEYTPYERTIYIYGLVDPRDSRIRYVGRSVDPQNRLAQHMQDVKHGKKGGVRPWLRQLQHQGLKPTIVVLATCTEADMAEVERHWIKEIGKTEKRLLNIIANDQFEWSKGFNKPTRKFDAEPVFKLPEPPVQ